MCKKMEKFNNFEKWSKNHNKNKTNKGTLMKVDESKKVWKKTEKGRNFEKYRSKHDKNKTKNKMSNNSI